MYSIIFEIVMDAVIYVINPKMSSLGRCDGSVRRDYQSFLERLTGELVECRNVFAEK